MMDLVPIALLASVVCAIAVYQPHRQYGVLGTLPLALVACIGVATAIGLLSSWTGVGLVSQPATVWLAACAVVVLAVVRWRQGAPLSSDVPQARAASSGFVVMATLVLAMGVLDPPRRLNWFLDADNVRHVVFTAEVWSTGALSYGAQTYPRGWHTTQAMLWSSADPALVPDDIVGLLTVSALSFWLAFAVMTLACGLITVRLVEVAGGSRRTQCAAGVAGGSAPLWMPFSGVYLGNGYQTSVVAALAIVTALLEVVSRSSRHRALAAATLAVVVVAHSWQILLPLPVLFVLVVLAQLARRRESGPTTVTVAGVLVATCVFAWPAVWSAVADIGLSHGREADVAAALPMLWVTLGVLLSLWLLVTARGRPGGLTLTAAAVVGAATLAAGLAAVLGIAITQYYPNKTLWQAALLSTPLVCAVGAVWLAEGMRRISLRPLRALIVGTVGAVVLAWLAYPVTALLGVWSSVDSAAVIRAVTSPAAPRADLVWNDDREDDTISRILLDVYRVSETNRRTVQHPADRDELCALLARSSAPTVLSDLPPGEVQQLFDCAPDVAVVPVSAAQP